MGRISPPDRGQPLDVDYIRQLVEVCNSLATSIATTSNAVMTIDTATSGKQSVKTSESRIVGGYKEVTNANVVNGEVSVEYPFQTNFQYPPVITATPIAIANADSGGAVSVMIKSVGQDKATFGVRFSGTGSNLSVGLNIIAVGIPSL
jgi:hypothetical protein